MNPLPATPAADLRGRIEASLEILENILYLAKLERPGSAMRRNYLYRAEDQLASLGVMAAEDRLECCGFTGSISH